MSGRKSKDKGYRFENRMVNDLNAAGIRARRIPLSGADPHEKGDIEIMDFGLCEAKNRESIGAYLWDWLDDYKVLFLKRNFRDPLVVMELEDWTMLMRSYTEDGPFPVYDHSFAPP